ncbi:uncharacterized protein LOC127790924 [Diospyros lotus]|uniref:uncharacterized protein LOC127790924 n=1 Tax=Diospyros lotus TaxID=55363 RepID=UPI00224FC9F3|nr:uncharacterized protein LOC127790924 [Diospyros lotus]
MGQFPQLPNWFEYVVGGSHDVFKPVRQLRELTHVVEDIQSGFSEGVDTQGKFPNVCTDLTFYPLDNNDFPAQHMSVLLKMARSHASFDKNTTEKAEKKAIHMSQIKTRKKIVDVKLEINKFFNARITRLDHFDATVELIRKALKKKPELEEQFKNSAFGHLVYDLDGLTWSNQLVHSLLLRLLTREDNDEVGSLCFRICGKDVKFGREEFALITGLKFGNIESAKRKIKVVGTPKLFTKFFPDCTPKKGVSGVRLRELFRKDIASGKVKCSDEDLLSLSYLMIINEINSKSRSKKVDMIYFHLASHWEEANSFPWANESFICTTDGARNHILNAFNQKQQKMKTYDMGGFPITLQIFMFEVMPHLVDLQLVERNQEGRQSPRINKWRLYDSKFTQDQISKLGIFDEKNKGYVTPIVPTEEEMGEHYYKNSQCVFVEEEESEDEEEADEEKEVGGEGRGENVVEMESLNQAGGKREYPQKQRTVKNYLQGLKIEIGEVVRREVRRELRNELGDIKRMLNLILHQFSIKSTVT